MKYVAIFFVASALIAYVASINGRLSRCESKNAELVAFIESQKLNAQAYEAQKPLVVEKIITKYQKIPTDSTSCVATLKSADDLLGAFYGR